MYFNSEEKLLEFTSNIRGKSFREIDTFNYLGNKKDKGRFGKSVETGFYGYKTNNDAKADFDNLGIELKVSGFIRNKNGTIRAKERISLSMINYNSIVNEEYEFSKLLFKNKKILILWYEYKKGVPEEDLVQKGGV